MAEIGVAVAPVTAVVPKWESKAEIVAWTTILWTELVTFLSGKDELADDPLLESW